MCRTGLARDTLYAALTALGLIAAVASWLMWRQHRGEVFLASYRQTKNILQCIEMGNSNYHELTGRYPKTVEESLLAAVSERYRLDASCSTAPTRERIVARRDGWRRPLEFERRENGNGIVEVTVISCGDDGVRQFGTLAASDDLVGSIYLSVPPEKSIRENEGDK